jgi:hypothetical protein
VEFTFRVYDDGRRERRATVLVRTADGSYRPEPRPRGELMQFVTRAILAAREEIELRTPRRAR